MDNKIDALAIVKELTICTLQNTNGHVFDREMGGKPEEMGKAVAKLFNSILENLKSR